MSTSSNRYQIVYVLGGGHSGSTLLNLLLNGHSQVVGLCEVDSLNQQLLLPVDDALYPLRNPFWARVAKCWESSTGLGFERISIETPTRHQIRNWTESDHRAYQRHNQSFLDCVARISGASHIVDTSRSRRRLELLAKDSCLSVRVIHLIRDGRGVVNSYRRKYGRFRIGLRRWMVPTMLGLITRKRMRRLDWLQLKYEDLAANPQITLRRLCEFLCIEYEDEMLSYWHKEDISIGGNRMRQEKKRVRLDEAWRRELSLGDRLLFATMGAWLNRALGYPVVGSYRPRAPADSLTV